MIGRILVLGLVLSILPVAAASAQKTPTPAATPAPVQVTFGDLTYAMAADAPVLACVTSSGQDVFNGGNATLVFFAQTPNAGAVPFAWMPIKPVGVLQGAKADDCFVLTPEQGS